VVIFYKNRRRFTDAKRQHFVLLSFFCKAKESLVTSFFCYYLIFLYFTTGFAVLFYDSAMQIGKIFRFV